MKYDSLDYFTAILQKKNYSLRLCTQNYKYDCVGTATDVTQY
jgi:hypothetical protein